MAAATGASEFLTATANGSMFPTFSEIYLGAVQALDREVAAVAS